MFLSILKIFASSVLVFTCLEGLAADRPAGVPEAAQWVELDRVTDGDTVVLRDGTRVRLHGIDAPERNQPYGSQATAALKLMMDRFVYFLETDTDRYGRVVGQLSHAGEGYDINASMVCAGYAWWYERYARLNSDLEDCQESAQMGRLGLWADDSPVAPWVWRRR